MSDLIASASSMTSISENQHIAIGKPANAITPATLTAMVVMAQVQGLQIHPNLGD